MTDKPADSGLIINVFEFRNETMWELRMDGLFFDTYLMKVRAESCKAMIEEYVAKRVRAALEKRDAEESKKDG